MIEINYGDKKFPEKLINIPDPPQKLYIEGNTKLLNSIGIAVIGSRHHSDYGRRMCKSFVKELVQNGVTIISGLAEGIDTIAHTTCLENGGNTVAVLPCGFKHIFPKQNNKLFKNIINLGGVAVTEYEPEVFAESKQFLQRNRIVSGLGIATLVIEAGYRSGTSVTARITKEQGKNVFCVPSSLDNDKGITSNEIIQNGGKLVTCVDDILEQFKDIKFVKRTEATKINQLINPEYVDVYNVLSDEPKHINEIVKEVDCDIKNVSYKLMMLELEEYIIKLPGENYKRK